MSRRKPVRAIFSLMAFSGILLLAGFLAGGLYTSGGLLGAGFSLFFASYLAFRG